MNEDLAALNTKLQSMLDPQETVDVEMTVPQALAKIAEVLAKPVEKAYEAKLKAVLEQIAKGNWEGENTSISIPIINDPLRVKEGTESISSVATMTSSKPGNSNWAYNAVTTSQKAALIAKLLQTPDKIPTFIEKSALTDKIDDIKKMFGLSDDDLQNEYDLGWKVGDLIRLLQNAVKVERLVNKAAGDEQNAPTTEQTPEKPDGTPVEPSGDPEKKDDEDEDKKKKGDEPPVGDPPVDPEQQQKAEHEDWPSDMAGENSFDPVKKQYRTRRLPWGHDAKTTERSARR